jgi:hypothetical protein
MKLLLHKTAACLVFISCLVLYAKSHFYRDPGSAFFDVHRAYEKKYSRHRQDEVQDWVNRTTLNSKLGQTKGGARASLCLALSSVKRKQTQYLEVCNLTTAVY